ncbi:MAG: serine/threonine protein kinase [Pleurocapsa sp.]
MNANFDLTSYGYKIEAELGRNREGGRITWKAIELKTQQTVVIKQFCFAIDSSSWSGYQAYEQEIKILEQLNHPGIPKYLNSMETEVGFCLIQEYIPASALNNFRGLTVPEIKQIALKILDILVYLQQLNPPILHRDLKPENILLDESFNAYLIDFGFASLGSKEVAGSSVFKGTPGFIAPEQIIKPTMASDIYSLGVTLVCLLTRQDISEIRVSAQEDDPYQLTIKSLLPQLDQQLISWLEKMTHAKVSQRFGSAVAAKDALLELALPKESPSEITPATNFELNSLLKSRVIAGIAAISSLTTVAVWAINFASGQFESTIINIAIAALAAVAIGITELGAVIIALADRQARWQAAALAMIIPVVLVTISSLIWGITEAVTISATIAVIEVLLFSYYWWQIPNTKLNPKIRASLWLAAIAIGITLGLKLIC